MAWIENSPFASDVTDFLEFFTVIIAPASGKFPSPETTFPFTNVCPTTTVEMVMPGDRIKMTAELIYPVAIEEGMRFAIREGGRTIGAGVVSKIVK